MTTHLVGQGALWAGMQELSKEDLAKAESAGFPVVLLILLFVFGSLAAAALPLALGFVSVLVTGALIFALSQVMEMSVFVTNMASMIGIGVAVDYSLFIVARYREEVAAGREPGDARAVAMATSGLAVLFSGLTVIISLAGLWMIDNTAIRSMALGAMLVVGVAILAATHAAAGADPAARPPGLHPRAALQRHRPAATRPPGAPRGRARLLAALDRRRDAPPGARRGRHHRGAAGARRARPRDDHGHGRARPVPARPRDPPGLRGRGGAAPARAPRRRSRSSCAARTRRRSAPPPDGSGRRWRDDPGVARVAEPVAARGGGAVLVGAEPRADGESPAAQAAVDRLRASLPAVAGPGASVDVGGVTASQGDMRDLVSGSMWKILLFLLGLSYLVLLVLLRSVVLPLKAVLVNLLSVGAAFGVLSLLYDQVDTLTPPLVLAVVFGLSMDYEVFLLSRIRERYEATGDTRTAVAQGLAASARTITSAARDHGRRVRRLRRGRRALDPADRRWGPRWRSRSTRRSSGSSSCRRRWSCWATGTGTCRARSRGCCRGRSFESVAPQPAR